MTEQFEYRGTWFLPSNKELRLFGILTYDRKNGGKLELFGNFENKSSLDGFKDEEIIQGVTSDSKRITLVNCFMTSLGEGRFYAGKEYGTSSVKYEIEFILEGVHIDKKDDLKFQQLSAKIQNLDKWIGIHGFSLPEDGCQNKETHISYKSPNNIEFQINNDWHGQFFFSFDAPLQPPQKATVTQNIYFHMSSPSEHSLTDLLRYFYWFQRFLVIGLYRKTYWQEIILCSKRFTTQLANTIKLTSIKLYPYHIDYETVEPQYTDMLFSYQDIKSEFPSLIKSWFEKCELLKDSLNLLFTQFYTDYRFSINAFLNLAQAAESFHKETHKGKKDWVLHDRLSEIVNVCSNSISILDSILGDKDKFVNQVKHSRNFYTHYGRKTEYILEGSELRILTEKLKLLLVCAFLLEIGMEHQKLSSLLENIDTRHLVN